MFGVFNDVKKRICIGSRIIKVCRGCSTRVYIWWHAYSTHLACKLWITAVKIVIFYEYIYKIIFFFFGTKISKKNWDSLKKTTSIFTVKKWTVSYHLLWNTMKYCGSFLINYCEILWNTVRNTCEFLSFTVHAFGGQVIFHSNSQELTSLYSQKIID